MLRTILKLFAAVALQLTLAFVVLAQTKPTAEQQKELQKAMDDVQAALKGGDADKIKEAKNKLIKLTDKYYNIPADNLSEEPYYDPAVDGEGSTGRTGDGKKKIRTRLGEKAFFDPTDGKTPSVGWLASTKIHEIIGHGGQAAGGTWYTDDKGTALNEIECYDLEIKNAEITGLSKGEIDELKKRRKAWYDKLNEANKKKVDKGDYTMAFLPPSDRSKQAFTGRAEVFVSGQVYADEVATATVRGTRTLDGLVVTTEVSGQKAETRTDKDGRMTIPIAQAAKTITAPTEAIIRVLDRTGNEVARTQTRILPGPAPDVVDRPTVNDIPSNLRRGDVVTIPGQSLGPQCEMIIGNQIQETLAASANEVTAYVDTPTLGTQDAWVRNPYGESRSFETNVYSFEVSAPRTTIRRGEELTATAQYRSLRPGTQVRFTNKTPEFVTMEIAGAKMTGNEAVVTIQDPNGTIPVRVKGLNPGAFSIAYEVISSPQK